MNNSSQKKQIAWLFLGTFVSAFLLLSGITGLTLLLAPAIVGAFSPTPDHRPQLPEAPERDESLIDVTALAGKQLFPSIPAVENIAPGNWIRIPSIGVNVPLVQSDSMGDEDVIKVLDRGAALYPNGVGPGHLGNAFIAAHSTAEPWKGTYRFAFSKINEVQPGNLIHIDYESARYTYRVTKQEIITPTVDYRVISNRPVPTITLMACWPLWSTHKRMIIHGELVHVTQLTQRPV